MHLASLASEDDFEGWRAAARSFALADVPPAEIVWRVGATPSDLFAESQPDVVGPPAFSVPRPFIDLARIAICHSDPERFTLLYALLLRLRSSPRLLDERIDPLVRRIDEMAKLVLRDMHKMRAFLRFRELEGSDNRYVAWFEPEYHILRINADFFVRRFTTIKWSILTPELSIHWDGTTLTEAPAVAKNWRNTLEPAFVPHEIAGAEARESSMTATARSDLGGNSTLAWEALREEAMGCTRCHLYKHATQTVFGEGPVTAKLMLVGEQPGDQEDLAGRPFVGPAGQLLDRALTEAGVDREATYITNAVKHFKFEQRGKRRVHSKPQTPEIEACKWWIEQERMLIRPAVTVALGATAARSMLGKVVTISGSRARAHVLEDGGEGWVTIRPSYLLRIDDRMQADQEFRRFVDDLRRANERTTAAK